MNPSTGTFISMDPAQGSIFDPVSLHKYLYANANPVMNRDPSGLDSEASLARLTIGMTISAMLDSAYLACQATAMAIFNSLSASLLSVMIGLTPLAMFVANNPAFTDLCVRAANGEISFNELREFLKDLYYRINDQISKLIDRIDNGNSSNSNNSSNNGSNSNAQPPQSPIDPNKIKHIFDNLEHGLDEFLNSYGRDKEAAYRAMQKAAQNYIDQNNITGEFKNIIVNVDGFDITVRGYVVNGVAKIGTAFIP